MRITDAHLKGLVDRLNDMTGSNSEPYTKSEKGFKANIGNFHIEQAYGGYKLVRMVSEGGATRDPILTGYTTRRILYHNIYAFIAGIELAESSSSRPDMSKVCDGSSDMD